MKQLNAKQKFFDTNSRHSQSHSKPFGLTKLQDLADGLEERWFLGFVDAMPAPGAKDTGITIMVRPCACVCVFGMKKKGS